jgi:hypothetical protein
VKKVSVFLALLFSLLYSGNTDFAVHSIYGPAYNPSAPYNYLPLDSLTGIVVHDSLILHPSIASGRRIGIAGTDTSGNVIQSPVLYGDTNTFSITLDPLHGYNVNLGTDVAILGNSNSVLDASNASLVSGESNILLSCYTCLVSGSDNDSVRGTATEVSGMDNSIDGGSVNHAEGYHQYSVLSGNYNHLEGSSHRLYSSNLDHVEGSTNYDSLGIENHIEGIFHKVRTVISHIEGNYNITNGAGQVDHVEGQNNRIGQSVSYSHIEGQYNSDSGNAGYTHMEGSGNLARGYAQYSHFEGENNSGGGYANILHMEGQGNIDSGNSSLSHLEGQNNVDSGNATVSHLEGQGNKDTGNGSYSHLEGVSNTNGSSYSHLEGRKNASFGIGSGSNHIEGDSNTVSSGYVVHVEGSRHTVSGTHNHVEGSGNTITSNYGHCEGSGSSVSANYAHAEASSTASGDYSHAEGQGSWSSGISSHAENQGSADGDYSHAEGSSESPGTYSHSEGENCRSPGYASHCAGESNVSHYTQTIVGQYAVDDSSNDVSAVAGQNIFKIGWGTGITARRDVFTVDAWGNAVDYFGKFIAYAPYSVGFEAVGNTPGYVMYDQSNPIPDSHTYDILAGQGSGYPFQMRLVNDAYNQSIAFLSVQRDTIKVKDIVMPMLTLGNVDTSKHTSGNKNDLKFAMDSAGIVGVVNGTPARIGIVGENVASGGFSSSAVALSSGVTKAIDSVSLTSGEWLVSGTATFIGSVTTTPSSQWCAGNSTSVVIPDHGGASYTTPPVFAYDSRHSTHFGPYLRISSTPTKQYCNMLASWTSGTGVTAYCYIEAERIR